MKPIIQSGILALSLIASAASPALGQIKEVPWGLVSSQNPDCATGCFAEPVGLGRSAAGPYVRISVGYSATEDWTAEPNGTVAVSDHETRTGRYGGETTAMASAEAGIHVDPGGDIFQGSFSSSILAMRVGAYDQEGSEYGYADAVATRLYYLPEETHVTINARAQGDASKTIGGSIYYDAYASLTLRVTSELTSETVFAGSTHTGCGIDTGYTICPHPELTGSFETDVSGHQMYLRPGFYRISVGTFASAEGEYWVGTSRAAAAGEFSIRLGPFGLEVVDPNRELLTPNGKITTDMDKLVTKGTTRAGVAADGVTELLLRAKVPGEGEVEFSLADGVAPQDGGLSSLHGESRDSSVRVTAQKTPQGYFAFAVYHAPEDFNSGGFQDERQRSVDIEAEFEPGSNEVLKANTRLTVRRPPLVLVHGVWSDSETWKMPLATDPRFDVTISDYRFTHASSFALNRNVIKKDILTALREYRQNGIAATQVDVGAHSMGALLTRLHIARSDYEKRENFMQGDVNRLISLNAPFQGSPWANSLRECAVQPGRGEACRLAFSLAKMPIDLGAVEDFSIGSPRLPSAATPVPSHALVGKPLAGNPVVALSPALVRCEFFLPGCSRVFENEQHDLIVSRSSQIAGMAPSATTETSTFPDGIHTENCKSAEYSTYMVDLLNTTLSSGKFSYFPANSTGQKSGLALQSSDWPSSGYEPFDENVSGPDNGTGDSVFVSGGLVISEPTDGAAAVAGEVVTVAVVPADGQIVTRVLLVGPDTAMLDDVAPFEFDLAVPLDVVGRFPIQVFGESVDGSLTASEPLNLVVTPDAELLAIEFTVENPVLDGPGDSIRMRVVGVYDDGLVRDVSSPEAGTTFLSGSGTISAAATIFTVDTAGLVEAVTPGVAGLAVSNSGLVVNTLITVRECLDQDGDGVTDCAGDCDDSVASCVDDCSSDADDDGTADCADCDDDVDTCAVDCVTDADGDGTIDCRDYCLDVDGDGYGVAGGAGFDCITEDCNDGAAETFPGADEICDAMDNDCDGTPDDGLDPDGDGIGSCMDNCPALFNPPEYDTNGDSYVDGIDAQEDYDGDGQGDACETGARLADIDLSARVDGFDLARLARAFGSKEGDLVFDISSDLDQDGRIDGDDLAKLGASFGMTRTGS